jgi:hypothetical protein
LDEDISAFPFKDLSTFSDSWCFADEKGHLGRVGLNGVVDVDEDEEDGDQQGHPAHGSTHAQQLKLDKILPESCYQRRPPLLSYLAIGTLWLLYRPRFYKVYRFSKFYLVV